MNSENLWKDKDIEDFIEWMYREVCQADSPRGEPLFHYQDNYQVTYDARGIIQLYKSKP